MHNIPYVWFLACLVLAAALTHASDISGDSPTMMTYSNDVMALEHEWSSTHRDTYFNKALALCRARAATPEMTVEYHTAHLDLASGVLGKSRDGFESRSDPSVVRRCQAEIIALLAGVNVRKLKELPAWPELRARYARILMFQHATWTCLRDPALDGAGMQLDSTEGTEPDPHAQERRNRNRRIALQGDLKRFLKEKGPVIDRFMIEAFSVEPADFRMLNELLAMGLYSAVDRVTLVTTVSRNITGLPDIVKIQLP